MRTGDISLPVSAWPHFTIRPFSVTIWLQMKRFYSVLGLRNIPLCAWATLSLFARVSEQPGWWHSGSSVVSPRPESLWYANGIQWWSEIYWTHGRHLYYLPTYLLSVFAVRRLAQGLCILHRVLPWAAFPAWEILISVLWGTFITFTTAAIPIYIPFNRV